MPVRVWLASCTQVLLCPGGTTENSRGQASLRAQPPDGRAEGLCALEGRGKNEAKWAKQVPVGTPRPGVPPVWHGPATHFRKKTVAAWSCLSKSRTGWNSVEAHADSRSLSHRD